MGDQDGHAENDQISIRDTRGRERQKPGYLLNSKWTGLCFYQGKREREEAK